MRLKMKKIYTLTALVVFASLSFVGRAQIHRLPTVTEVDCNYSREVTGVDDMAWTWWFGPQVWSVNDYKDKLWWGYTSARGYTGIAEYDATDGTFRKMHLKKCPWNDDHNNSVVVLLPDRRVACIYTYGHDKSNQVFVRISSSYESIDEFDDAIPIEFAGTTTYIQYFFMNGKHYIFTRTKQDTYKWAWTCSEDMVNWTEPAEFITATNKRYYIKLQRVTDAEGIIRIIAYGHPTQSKDCRIRMGFINFNDGKVYNKDGKTVVTQLGNCFDYTELDVLISNEEGKVLRLFDVAATPMDECAVALASFTKDIKTDSRYLIYKNGSLQDLTAGGLPFWNYSVYLGGITFLSKDRVALCRNDGHADYGTDYVELWKFKGKKWKKEKCLHSEKVGTDIIRNLRPIVDYNGRYLLWQRGCYDHRKKGHTFTLEAKIYDLEKGKLIR